MTNSPTKFCYQVNLRSITWLGHEFHAHLDNCSPIDYGLSKLSVFKLSDDVVLIPVGLADLGLLCVSKAKMAPIQGEKLNIILNEE